jgi:hypothetical protein
MSAPEGMEVDQGTQTIEGVLQMCVGVVETYLGHPPVEQSADAFRGVVLQINQHLSEFVGKLKPQGVGKRPKLDRTCADVPSGQIDDTNLCLDRIVATQDAMRMFIQSNSKCKNGERHAAFVVVQSIKWDILGQFVDCVRLCNENHRKCLRLISDVNQASFSEGRKTTAKRQRPKSRRTASCGNAKTVEGAPPKAEDAPLVDENDIKEEPEVEVVVDAAITKQDDAKTNAKKRAPQLESMLSVQTAKVGLVAVSYNFLFRKMLQLCSRKSIRRQYTTSLNRVTTSPVGFAQVCFISDKLAGLVRETLRLYDVRSGTEDDTGACADGCFHSRPSIMKFLHLYGRENDLFDEEHRGSLRTNAVLKDLFETEEEYVKVNRLQKYIRRHCARSKETIDACSAMGSIADAVEKWTLVLSDADVHAARVKTGAKRKRVA